MSQIFRRKKISSLFLLIILSYSGSTLGQNIAQTKLTTETLDITASTAMFIEQGDSLTIEQAQRQNFAQIQETKTNQMYIPFSDNTLWLKWEFENETKAEQSYIIQFKNELLEYVEIYQFNDSLQTFTNTGFADFLTTKRNTLATNEPMLNFTLRKSGSTIIYAKLRSQRGLVMKIIAFPQASLEGILIANFGRMSFTNGVLVFRLMLILILGFFIVKVRAFRAYSFLILLKTLGYWGLLNYLGPRFADTPLAAQKIDYLSYTANIYGVIVVAYALLPMSKLPKWIWYAFGFILVSMVANHACVIYDYDWLFLQWGILQVIIYSGFIICLFAYANFKKWTIQYYYAIPFLMGIGSYFLFNSRLLFHWDLPLVAYLTFLMFLAEIVVFIFFLGKIFRDNEFTKMAVARDLLIKEEQAKQLKELDELKNQFFTNISHELKTPLTLIAGPVQELSRISPNDKLLKLVKSNLQRLQDLVSQLLDIQKLEAGKEQFKFEIIDLSRHLRLHVFSFESMAESKGIRLHLKQNKEQFLACVDVDKLNKIIDNLLTNAIKYSKPDTNISIKAVYLDNPRIFKFQVADEGFGISKADLPYIFDRFYQVKTDNYQGTGVGLTLVNELVNILKGTLDVKSELNVGTQFLITLPVDEQDWQMHLALQPTDVKNIEPNESGQLPQLQTPATQNTEKELVLVVDDNLDMQEYLQLLLQDNYEVITADNGKEGIEKANEEIPDLIISDLMMPLMDGFEFSRRIKNQLTSSHVPIVMLTAKDTKESKLEGFEIGIDHFLAKPFDADELKLIVRKSIDNRKRLKVLFGKENLGAVSEVLIEDEFLNRLNSLLEETHKNTKLTVVDMASGVNMSDKQLRRKLKAIGALSPLEYLRKFRLQKAADLLRNPSASVSEIAFDVGFENLSYFSKVFQQEYGVLPSEYEPV